MVFRHGGKACPRFFWKLQLSRLFCHMFAVTWALLCLFLWMLFNKALFGSSSAHKFFQFIFDDNGTTKNGSEGPEQFGPCSCWHQRRARQKLTWMCILVWFGQEIAWKWSISVFLSSVIHSLSCRSTLQILVPFGLSPLSSTRNHLVDFPSQRLILWYRAKCVCCYDAATSLLDKDGKDSSSFGPFFLPGTPLILWPGRALKKVSNRCHCLLFF